MFIKVMVYVLSFLEVIVCAMLLGIILIQRSKGQGMGAAFGGTMGESLFGTQMGNVLTKATVVLAVIFLVNTTVLARLNAGRWKSASLADEIVSEQPIPVPAQPGMPALPPMPAEMEPITPVLPEQPPVAGE
jgi:preprotein translocase subunit SecG